MLYREAGQFKTSYATDQQIFPIAQDRFVVFAILVFAFGVVPLIANQYWLSAILTPFLIFALAAIGLNLLTGYAGQLSLGTAAFMAVGAFAAYNFMLRVPGMPILIAFVLAGVMAALVGIVFGLPSLRIKGFYLAVATLAAQFFIVWALTKFGWFSNHSSSGVINAQQITILGVEFDYARREIPAHARDREPAGACREEPRAKLDRTRVDGDPRHGRRSRGGRHPDAAHQARRLRRQLVLLRRGGRAVRLLLSRDRRAGGLQPRPVVPHPVHDHPRRHGQHPGIVPRRRIHRAVPDLPQLRSHHRWSACSGVNLPPGLMSNLELMIFGALIVVFLIVEPHGLARLWQIAKEKLRLWPFPH